MYLEFVLKADAQAKADAIHAAMIAASPAYKVSVMAGQTTCWDVPKNLVAADGKVGATWAVTVKAKVDPVLTPADRLGVKS